MSLTGKDHFAANKRALFFISRNVRIVPHFLETLLVSLTEVPSSYNSCRQDGWANATIFHATKGEAMQWKYFRCASESKTLPQSCPTRSSPSTPLCLHFRIVFIQANSRDVHFSAFLPSTLILMAVRDARASFLFIGTAAPVCLRRRKRCRSCCRKKSNKSLFAVQLV